MQRPRHAIAAALAALPLLITVPCAAQPPQAPGKPLAPKVGRPVRITSLCFGPRSQPEIIPIVQQEAARGVDLICLPETWFGQNEPEPLDGDTIQALSVIARVHRTWILSPIDRKDGDQRLNSAVLINRDGKVAGVYDKVFPYWSEFDLKPPVSPAPGDAPVFETDFGKIGVAICFDANFPEVWQRLADKGAELVIWPSAYSAGTQLQAHALNHHFYIITATYTGDCQVYDITGERIVDSTKPDINITRVVLDLDRGVYHTNFNTGPRDKLLAEHPDEVKQDKMLEREQWFVLQATKPGVSARELARQYDMEELRDYKNRSREAIDEMRGWTFDDGPPAAK